MFYSFSAWPVIRYHCGRGGTIVYATLLDAGQYLCSERTMYRVLAAHQEVRERRDQLRHPAYAAPDLLARRPNELWSWDITNHVKEIYGVCRRRVDLRRESAIFTTASSRPLILLIVPTYGRPASLRRRLGSVAAQEYPRDSFEVIVDDDGSRRPVDDRLRTELPGDLPLPLVRESHQGVAVAGARSTASQGLAS